MIKIFAFLFVSGILFFNLLFTDEVSLTMDIPTEVVAGSNFIIEINIHKEDLQSFARFQQELPDGFTATEQNSANGEFNFIDQKVKLIWLNLPKEEEFTISYNVYIHPTAIERTVTIGGQFIYIKENERVTADISPQSIIVRAVGELADITPALVDISTDTGLTTEITTDNINCSRKKLYSPEPVNEIIVNILINKDDNTGFAKIQEQIPEGYSAYNIESKDAIFTFNDRIVKFLWVNLPVEPQYSVSYKLIPENYVNLQELSINGKFSYVGNEITQSVDIIEKETDLLAFNNMLIQDIETETETETQTETETETEVISEVETETETYESEITSIPEPETGISYRVQVAAGHKLVDVENYFKKLNINNNIKTEPHEGWIKYTIGSFAIYKSARDQRVNIWNTTPINDAFVSAYNNGLRITVQEALMIANQKWYN